MKEIMTDNYDEKYLDLAPEAALDLYSYWLFAGTRIFEKSSKTPLKISKGMGQTLKSFKNRERD